jgi:adiponectin receptor
MYSVLGLSIFIPAIHGVILHGWTLQNERMSLTYFMGLGILNGTGTAIYTARVPERWYPRRFDIYGSSHQIMHVLVVCGALSHTIGLVKAFDYWQGLGALDGGACAHI